MFEVELRNLAIVPRWTVMRTVGRETVASHSMFVALYAEEIADVIGWKGDRHLLMKAALLHDADESLTGDIPGPVKQFLMVRETMFRLESAIQQWLPSTYKFRTELQSHPQYPDIALIVRAADKIDALLFLLTEIRQGNTHLRPAANKLRDTVYSNWMELRNLELTDIAHRLAYSIDLITHEFSALWNNAISRAIDVHTEQGGKGLWQPTLISETQD